MTDENIAKSAGDGELVIPDGTQFVIVDLDHKNEMVQVAFSLDGKVVREWFPASHFEQMKPN